MSRLIDADKFIEFMEEKCNPNAELDPIILGVVRGAIKEQPTAYDVDKVQKELEDGQMWRKFMLYDLTYREHCILRKAIEIVKKGGVENE